MTPARAADLLHVKEAIRKAAFDEKTSVTVKPPGPHRGWALNVKALVADLRAAGYSVRTSGYSDIEITWAPMAPCRRVLWNWGVL